MTVSSTTSAKPYSLFRRAPIARVTLTHCPWPVQASDVRGMSDAAIVQEIESTKKERVLLNVKKATRQEVKAHHFALLRKKVAILKTVRRERELEQGVKKRESRAVDRQQRLGLTFW